MTENTCDGCKRGLPIHGGNGYWYHRDETGFFDSYCTAPKTTDAWQDSDLYVDMRSVDTYALLERAKKLELEIAERKAELKVQSALSYARLRSWEKEIAKVQELRRQLEQAQEALRREIVRYEWIWKWCEVIFWGAPEENDEIINRAEIESRMPDEIKT